MTTPLNLLSGGAAQGLVAALAPRFKAETGCDIVGTFGAVGAMRDKLLAGAPADLLILTSALIAELAATGHVLEGATKNVGVVRTGIAVRAGDAPPDVLDAAALRAALLAADAIYVPDPKLATAGIHFAKVLDALGIASAVAVQLKPFANGAQAMHALSQDKSARPIGCTQVTEIIATPGVTLVGPLPKDFELATLYTAGVCRGAANREAAQRLAELLSGQGSADQRLRAGFEAPRAPRRP
jgi:molybdate transport system substrate-binding protein